MKVRILAVFCVLLAGCGQAATHAAADASGGDAAGQPGVSVTKDGIRISTAAGSVDFYPVVSFGGGWLASNACTVAGAGLQCPIYGGPDALIGTVSATFADGVASAAIELAQDATVAGLGFVTYANLGHAPTTWLSNGFQSWSQSGSLAIQPTSDEATLAAALEARGDAEVIRKGSELSWWYTVVGGSGSSVLAGALDAARFKSWVGVQQTDTRASLGIASGAAGEAIHGKKGDKIQGEPWFIAVGPDPNTLLADYGKRLAALRSKPLPQTEAGWNSWYEFWDSVTEADVRANAPLAKAILTPVLPNHAPVLRIVVDDGWESGWGDWTPNAKFPSGLDGLAKDLKADGFRMGVWLAPLLAAESSAVYKAHPDWFVQGAVYNHLKNGNMHVLDVTHPDAAAHLASVISQLVAWGYDLLKIDFLFAGTWEGGRHESVTGMEAYNRALQIIRKAAGDKTILLAVGAPPLPTLRYVDAWRSGTDIAVENFGPSWPFLPNQLRSLGAHLPFCAAMRCDADPVLLRTLTHDEVDFGAWTVAMAGGGLFLSDDLTKLPAERKSWGLDIQRVGLALGGMTAIPKPFFPDNPPPTLTNPVFEHLQSLGEPVAHSLEVVPLRWTLPDGGQLALNPGDTAQKQGATDLPPHSATLLP